MLLKVGRDICARVSRREVSEFEPAYYVSKCVNSVFWQRESWRTASTAMPAPMMMPSRIVSAISEFSSAMTRSASARTRSALVIISHVIQSLGALAYCEIAGHSLSMNYRVLDSNGENEMACCGWKTPSLDSSCRPRRPVPKRRSFSPIVARGNNGRTPRKPLQLHAEPSPVH